MKLLGAVCFLGGVILGAAELQALPLRLAFDREGEGLAIAQAGVGLMGWTGSGPRILTVRVDGPVELAWLYWTGREFGCTVDPDSGVCAIQEQPYKDQILRLDGVPVTGVLLGTEFQPASGRGPILNVAYGLDVTEQARAKGTGRLTFRLTDAEPERNLSLDGAGLFVVYTAPDGPTARVIGLHGLDFAHGEDFTPGETTIAHAVTFSHGAAKRDRQGEMVLFTGGGKGARRPDRIEIRNNPALVDRLDGSSGAEWDFESIPVLLPGQTLSTTVQILSEPWGKNPDSFNWVMAALWLPLPEPEGCTVQVWNNRKEWTGTGVAPGQRLQDVFSESFRYGIGQMTLRGALRFRSEAGPVGAAKALVRDGTAALLNATHLWIEYPYARSQVIVMVDGALRSGDVVRMGELAALLREANGAECP